MAFFFGGHGRCCASVVGLLGIGAMFEQEFDHGAISVLRSGVERRPTSLLTSIDGRTVLDQEAGRFEVAGGCGGVEGHDFHSVRGDDIDGCSVVDEETRRGGLSEEAGEMQGSESVAGA